MADVRSTLRRLGRVAGAAAATRRRPAPTVDDSRMSLVEHLKELRRRLLIAFIAVADLGEHAFIGDVVGRLALDRREFREPPRRARFGAGGQENLELGLWKNNRSLIAAFGDNVPARGGFSLQSDKPLTNGMVCRDSAGRQ